MKSRARIGNHPLHPAMVALPVGAFFLALVADIAYVSNPQEMWGEIAFVAIGVGVVTALIAAVLGFIDFTALPEGSRVRSVAVTHMMLNLAAVTLYAISFYRRWNAEEVRYAPDNAALLLAFVAIAVLMIGGWLGGKMVYELRAGVVEPNEAPVPRQV